MTTPKDGQPAQEELDPQLRIRAPLRCDGIGSLDCAEDVATGMRMAIRWLPLEANGDAAAAAMRLLPVHPTLPKIRLSGHVGAAAYVAMEFPDGQLLSTLLETPWTAETLCRIGAETADALATVHAQGVYHGELSAESLLILNGEKAVLWDMPLVVANRFTDRRGEERVMASTVRMAAYLSPERAQGLPPSESADVYALGAVLCLAAGTQPPSGPTTLSLIFQIASGQWRPEVPQRYTEPVRALLARMVGREAQGRPTAREVALALGRPQAIAATIPEMRAVPAPAAAPVTAAASLPKAQVPASATAPVTAAASSPKTPVPASATATATATPVNRTVTPADGAVTSPNREAVSAPVELRTQLPPGVPAVPGEDAHALVTDPGLGPFEPRPAPRSMRGLVVAVLVLIGVLAATAGYLALRPQVIQVSPLPPAPMVDASAPVAGARPVEAVSPEAAELPAAAGPSVAAELPAAGEPPAARAPSAALPVAGAPRVGAEAAPPPGAVAAPAPDSAEDLLSPVPLKGKPPRAAAGGSRHVQAKKPAEPAPAKPAVEAAPAKPTAADFDFLPTGDDKPEAELKRPAF